MEKTGTLWRCISYEKWWCSIVMLVFGELSLNILGWNTPWKTTHHFQPFPALPIHPRNGSSKNTIDGLTLECPYPLVLVKRLNSMTFTKKQKLEKKISPIQAGLLKQKVTHQKNDELNFRCIFLWSLVPSWCFQPIWKTLVKMGIFPK